MNALSNWLLSVQRAKILHTGDESECRPDYLNLINCLPQAVFQIETTGAWVFLSEGWQRLTGFSVQESLGTDFRKYFHPQDIEVCSEYLARVRAGEGDPGALRLRCLIDGHGLIWVEMRARSIVADNATAVVGTLTDVTERVREDEALQASHRALSNLIDGLPGMAYRGRNNQDWTMEYVSAGSRELTGYAPADIIDSRHLSYGSLIHPDDRERVWNEVQAALREERRFELVYRIRTADGSEKWAWERGSGIFSSSGELLALEGFIIDVTQSKRDEQRLRDQLLYDLVTGLRTSDLFIDHINHALKKAKLNDGYAFALLLLDLDRTHGPLNRFGAKFVDRAAFQISRLLKDGIEPAPVISRLKDERFGILLEHVNDIREVINVARSIQDSLRAPLQIDDSEVYVTASIGIALSASGYERSEDMLQDAELALGRARALGGGRYEVFDLQINAKVAALSQMEDELQVVLERNELCLYWQPTISLQNGRVGGLEARLVWSHPRRGNMFSDQFIALVENTQLTIRLWEWMFAAVCAQIESWQRFSWKEDVTVYLQVPGEALLDEDFIARLEERLDKTGPASCGFAFCISEDFIARNPTMARERLEYLRARNLRFVLDAFGSSTASLAVVQDMPIDMIRLDGATILAGQKQANFIAALVAFAHALHMKVIVDGIETEQQLSLIRELGCDYAQGNGIAAPVAVANLPYETLLGESGAPR